MRILIVGNVPTPQEILGWMKGVDYVVSYTTCNDEGLSLATRYDQDIILVDTPEIDGYTFLRTLRKNLIHTPVIILDDHLDKDLMLQCLSGGADDFMVEPFNREELLVRIMAIVRRTRGHADSIIKTGRIEINLDAKTVTAFNGPTEIPVHLSDKEFRILELLSLRKDTTLTKEMFMDHLYGGMDEPEVKIIDVFICKLRKKLKEATGGQNYIETIWGHGYRLSDPVEEPA